MKRNDIIGISVLLTALIIFAIVQTSNERSRYEKKGVCTTGIIIQVKDDFKHGNYIKYQFTVNNKTYTGETGYVELKKDLYSKLINRVFPVIYINDNPEESQILITKGRFKRKGIPFPDSLKWTKELETP